MCRSRRLLSGIKRGSSYVPLHRCKCENKIPANNRLFIRKSSPKRTDELKYALGDLINYAKTTETITKHLKQMRLEDANSTTKPTTTINALVNKVAHEQQRPRKRSRQNRCRIAMGNTHMNGDRHPALHS